MTRDSHHHAYAVITLLMLVALAGLGYDVGWRNVLATPDQRGAWSMREARYEQAAQDFRDPVWRAVATFRAGDFKEAARILSGLDTADAAYNHGNALVMLGQYEDAVKRYDRALALRPGWSDAEANRALARLRAERLKTTGGDTGNTDSQPDQVVFDASKPKDDAAHEIRAPAVRRCPTRRRGLSGCAASRRNPRTSCGRSSPISYRSGPPTRHPGARRHENARPAADRDRGKTPPPRPGLTAIC